MTKPAPINEGAEFIRTDGKLVRVVEIMVGGKLMLFSPTEHSMYLCTHKRIRELMAEGKWTRQ